MMQFGPKRGNILIIFDKFLKNFGLLLFSLALFFAVGPSVLTDNFYVLIIGLISPVAKLIGYFTTYYTVDERVLTIEKGIFIKKKTEIPLSTITTVDLSQDILYQFFGIYKMKIDNASQVNDTANKAELTVALKKEEAELVKSLLLQKTANGDKPEEEMPIPTVKAPVRDFFLLGLMQSKLLYFLTFVPVISTVSALVMTEEMDQGIINVFNTAVNTFGAAALAAFGTIAVYLITLIFSIIQSIFTYLEFTVSNRGDALLVEYGLLSKKKYTLLKSKISGIALRQSALMRFFGYCAVEVFVIGYGDKSGDEQKEEAILYPLMKKSAVPYFLSGILPEFSLPLTVSRPKRKSFHYFFYSLYFVLALLSLVFFLFVGNPYATAGAGVALIAATVGVVFEYKTTGVSSNKDNITFVTGIFAKRTTVIKTEAVESVSFIASILKEKKGVGHIKLGFLAPLRVAKTKVRNIDIEEYEKIKGLVRY